MGTRVIVSDDHQIVREGLRTLLEKQRDLEVVAEAADGRSAVELARQLGPDLVIMDVGMPGLNGIDATRQILREAPGIKVIGLSMHADAHFVEGMLKAGAAGYLLKECAFEELTAAIREVLADGTYVSSHIKGFRHGGRRSPAPASTPGVPALTAKELEVLRLIAAGKTTREIASGLCISVKTVETHRQHIAAKLGLHTVAELTKYAVREGLASLEGPPVDNPPAPGDEQPANLPGETT
jgi:DNA-binding NarL/FixJ family response regulator